MIQQSLNFQFAGKQINLRLRTWDIIDMFQIILLIIIDHHMYRKNLKGNEKK